MSRKNRVALFSFVATALLWMTAFAVLPSRGAYERARSGDATFNSTPTPSTRPRTVTPGAVPVPDLGPGASLHGKRLFPPDNPWNQDISNSPVDPNSANLIKSIGAEAVRDVFRCSGEQRRGLDRRQWSCL